MDGTSSSDLNVCFFSGEQMQPWLTVPCDRTSPARAGGPWHVFRAPESDFAWIWPRPTAEQVASFDTHPDDEPEDCERRFVERLLARVAWSFDRSRCMDDAWIADLAEGRRLRVCEVGVGPVLRRFRALGNDCVGVDPDPHAREEAAHLGLTVHAGTAEHLPRELGVGAFDVVILAHVLEHTRDPARALRNCSQLLAAHGRLIIETPNNTCLGAMDAGASWALFDAPRHLSFFTAKSLVTAVEHAGLVVERTELCGFTRQFQRDWRLTGAQMAAGLASAPVSPSTSLLRAWGLLARSILSPRERRYDSVRVVARRGA